MTLRRRFFSPSSFLFSVVVSPQHRFITGAGPSALFSAGRMPILHRGCPHGKRWRRGCAVSPTGAVGGALLRRTAVRLLETGPPPVESRGAGLSPPPTRNGGVVRGRTCRTRTIAFGETVRRSHRAPSAFFLFSPAPLLRRAQARDSGVRAAREIHRLFREKTTQSMSKAKVAIPDLMFVLPTSSGAAAAEEERLFELKTIRYTYPSTYYKYVLSGPHGGEPVPAHLTRANRYHQETAS